MESETWAKSLEVGELDASEDFNFETVISRGAGLIRSVGVAGALSLGRDEISDQKRSALKQMPFSTWSSNLCSIASTSMLFSTLDAAAKRSGVVRLIGPRPM